MLEPLELLLLSLITLEAGLPDANIFGRGLQMTILLIVLILALIGAYPGWGYSRGWSYYPSGGIGLILLILIILILVGRVPL